MVTVKVWYTTDDIVIIKNVVNAHRDSQGFLVVENDKGISNISTAHIRAYDVFNEEENNNAA